MNGLQNGQQQPQKTVVQSGGVGIGTLTFLVLLVLKILGHLPMMSWFAVLTSWLWIPLGILSAFLVLYLVIAGILGLIQWVADGFHR